MFQDETHLALSRFIVTHSMRRIFQGRSVRRTFLSASHLSGTLPEGATHSRKWDAPEVGCTAHLALNLSGARSSAFIFRHSVDRPMPSSRAISVTRPWQAQPARRIASRSASPTEMTGRASG